MRGCQVPERLFVSSVRLRLLHDVYSALHLIVALLQLGELLVEATREPLDVVFDASGECLTRTRFLLELFGRHIDALLERSHVVVQIRSAGCDGVVHQRPPFTTQST